MRDLLPLPSLADRPKAHSARMSTVSSLCMQRGLEIFRADIPSALEGLGLRRELRGVLPVDAAKELEKVG